MSDPTGTIDQLSITIAANADTAAVSVDRFTAALRQMNNTLGLAFKNLNSLSPALVRAQQRMNKGVGAVGKMTAATGAAIPTAVTGAVPAELAQTAAAGAAATKQVSKLSTVLTGLGRGPKRSVDMLGGSFIQLRSKIFFALFALTVITGFFKLFIGAAASYVEKINLFKVAFGDAAGAANTYADAITRVLGIDPVAFRETYSSFYLIANSLGMAADKAMTLSQNITQLAYDYASIFEMDFEDVTAKFRSAMAGQTRAISYFGLDVTIASLQEEALREGIEGNVREFSKANKIILMHNLIVRNSAVVQGDLARTLSSPANMMRILKDQFAIAARVIGYMFMPMLKALLPWLIVITRAIANAASALLGFFGITMPKFSDISASIGDASGGTDDLFEGMEDAAGATGRAAKAAKELRDYVMGIDELNVIAPETPSAGGGGGGGAGGGGGVDIEPFDVYDMIAGFGGLDAIIAPLMEKFKALGVTFKPFIDALGRLWDALVPFAKNVWSGFEKFYLTVLVPLGTWTLNVAGVFVLDQMTKILGWFDKHPKVAENLGFVVAALLTFKGLGFIVGIGKKVVGFLLALVGVPSLGVVAANLATLMTLLPNAGGALGWFFTAIGAGEPILAAFSTAFGGVSAFITTFVTALGWVALAIVGFAANMLLLWWSFNQFKKGVELFVTTVKDTFDKWGIDLAAVWQGVKDTTTKIWESIVDALVWVWSVIKAVIIVPLALIGTALILAWDAVKTKTVEVWETVKTKTKEAWDWVYEKIRGPLAEIWAFIEPTFNLIRDKISEVWAGLSEGLSAAWGTIKSIFKSGVNALIDLVNNGPIAILNGIIKAAQAVDKTGLMGSVNLVAKIPRLAAGGILGDGQMFVAGENGKVELTGRYNGQTAVMPLENSGFVEAMASAVYSATVAALNSTQQGGNGTGDVYIDGVKAGKIIRNSETRAGTLSGLVTVGNG